MEISYDETTASKQPHFTLFFYLLNRLQLVCTIETVVWCLSRVWFFKAENSESFIQFSQPLVLNTEQNWNNTNHKKVVICFCILRYRYSFYFEALLSSRSLQQCSYRIFILNSHILSV